MNDVQIRALRRVLGLYADGKLSLTNLVKDSLKEELITALKKDNPELGNSAELADIGFKILMNCAERGK